MNDNNQMIVVLIGVLGLIIIELYALSKGVDGVMLSAVIGGITAIIGYCFGIFKRSKEVAADVKKVNILQD